MIQELRQEYDLAMLLEIARLPRSTVQVDIVECNLEEGIVVIPQEVTSFTLASGDEIMLLQKLAPVCDAWTLR